MKYFPIVFLLLFFHSAKSQITVFNRDLIDTSRNQMYLGFENKIVVTSINTRNLVLKANKSTIQNFESNIYYTKPFKTGLDTLEIYSNGKVTFSWPYRIDSVPYPIARIAGTTDTVLNVYQILRQPVMSIVYPSTNLKANVQVVRFTSIINGNEGYYEEISSSYYFTPRQKELIKRLKSGDTIYFDNIYTSCPTGRSQKMQPFTIYIR